MKTSISILILAFLLPIVNLMAESPELQQAKESVAAIHNTQDLAALTQNLSDTDAILLVSFILETIPQTDIPTFTSALISLHPNLTGAVVMLTVNASKSDTITSQIVSMAVGANPADKDIIIAITEKYAPTLSTTIIQSAANNPTTPTTQSQVQTPGSTSPNVPSNGVTQSRS
jgi:hypothetical protein